MKKHFLSALFALMLMLMILPCASADYIYPAPAAVPAGKPLNHLVATVGPDSAVAANLPDGLSLVPELVGDETNVYLRGTLYVAGTYACIINVDNTSSFTCPVTILPEEPAVAVSPALRCYPGETAQINVSAGVSGQGQLSYQWYRSASPEDRGSSVEGATAESLTISAAELGTVYYRCLVSNSMVGLTSSVLSDPIEVTVEEVSVAALSIEMLPERVEYAVGETLDTTGLAVRAELTNGDVRILMEGFGVYPIRLEEPGTQPIEVSYQGQTCSFAVYVQEAEEVITGIGVLRLPDKTRYVVGEDLDPAGLAVRVYTADGHRDVTEGLSCSPTHFDKADEQTEVTVKYGSKSCTFNVRVSQSVAPVGLSVAKLPAKIQYSLGETLDTTGLIIRQVDSNNDSTDIQSGFTCSPTVLDTPGHQEITVTYGDLSCRFNVTVNQAAAPVATATPAPTATPTPTRAPAPTATPAPTTPVTPEPPVRTNPIARPAARSDGSAKTLFSVVLVASVLALAGLGGFVFVMNRGGMDQASETVKNFFDRFRRH